MSLFLTKIEIDYETSHKNGLRDSYDWHRWAWECFPGMPEAKRNFLTRLDNTGHGFRFLIQSGTPTARPTQCPADAFHTKEIPESFFQHPGYRFSLLANPTIKKVVRDEAGNRKKNGQRIAISQREDLLTWISQKAAQHGFTVNLETLQTIPRPRQLFTKRSGKDTARHHGTHTATEFTGTLKVTDPTLFQKSVRTGIGSAKAFGFGMLCLSPV